MDGKIKVDRRKREKEFKWLATEPHTDV